MATFDDSKRDAADLATGMNEDTTFNTRYGVNPKKSFPMAIREIETSGTATVNQIQNDAANAIATLNTSRGFRVVGTFADGFTYELFNDVGIDASGNSWIYVGTGVPNKVVTAGTVPSAPDYEQITFNAASGVIFDDGSSVQEFRDTVNNIYNPATMQEAINYDGWNPNGGEVFRVQELLNGSNGAAFYKTVLASSVVIDGVNYVQSVGVPNLAFELQNSGRGITADLNNFEQKDYLSCIPRCIGGVWELLSDAGHDTLGVASIEKSDDYRIRINYDKQYSKVNNLSINIDQELAPYGVFCGGNVGVAWAEWTAYAQLTGLLRVSDLSFTSTALIPSADTSVTLVDDVLTLNYANAVSGDVPTVSVVNKNGSMPMVSVSYGVGQLQVRAITDLAGFVRYSGGKFEWYPGFDNYISSSQAGISFSESGGVLTVTHPSTYGYDIQISAFGDDSYNVKVTGAGSGQFSVSFYDVSTGAKITTPDAKMILFIKRKMDLKGVIPSDLELTVRGPIIPIKSSNMSNIPGNNFWINGVMQGPL